jgi:hypothetical protein
VAAAKRLSDAESRTAGVWEATASASIGWGAYSACRHTALRTRWDWREQMGARQIGIG